MGCGFACTPPCILRRALPLSTRWLPVCVTPVNTLTYYRIGSHAPPPPGPKARKKDWVVSITGLGMVGPSPVREYQPVVHRLRLSASP